MNFSQPLRGILATFVVMAISFGFIAFFPFHIFAGWVGFYLVCSVSVQTLLAIAWKGCLPGAIARLCQPLKGLLFTIITGIIGFFVAAILYLTVGAGVSPPSPMVTHYSILCVILSFLMTIMWGGWPFTSIFKSAYAKGISLFLGYFAVGYVLFYSLCDYSFLKGTPVYIATSDPKGLFMAWIPLTLCIGTVVGMFTMMCFDLWPLSKYPRLMKQPTLGLLWSVISGSISLTMYYFFAVFLKIDVVVLMTRIFVPFVFGFIVVLFMLQGALFASIRQPLKGIFTTALSLGLGYLFSLGYLALAPILSGPLPSGPPSYSLEIWNATALLGVTFPFLTVSSAYFEFWPFVKTATCPTQ